jgi:undecaprenyl-diphosphatase
MNLHLIIISILEGLTEFLPISSTAHLILAAKILNVDTLESYTKFYLLFIQLGALLAGFIIFARRIFTDKQLFINICISFIPTAILGFIFYKLFKHLLEGNIILIGATLFFGGIILIYIEKKYMRKIAGLERTEISKIDALIIGSSQALAIVPGVSRAGATIVAGIMRKIKKEVIFEYSFILALPTILAAVLYDAYKSRDILIGINSYNDLIIGSIISFVVASVVLYLLKKYLSQITLSSFGWYRIILGIIIFLTLL